MEKNDLINNRDFASFCNKWGSNPMDCEYRECVVALPTSVDGLYVFADSKYNVFNIKHIDHDNVGLEALKEYKKYCEFTGNESYEETFGYPLEGFTLKQIMDINDRVEIEPTNHGHSSRFIINGKIYNFIDGKYDELNLLAYIKFLAAEAKYFFEKSYHLQVLGFPVPDVYSYLKEVVKRLNACVDIHVAQSMRPSPRGVLNYLGQNGEELNVDMMLYDVIDMMIEERGYSAVTGTPNDAQKNWQKTKETDLSTVANTLLKILEVSDKEVEEMRNADINTRTTEKVKDFCEKLQSPLEPNSLVKKIAPSNN